MNDSGQNDNGMDVDMLEKEEAVEPASQRRVPASVPPNQNAVEAVNVPPPSRKGRHWTPQQRSDAKDSKWEPISKEKVKAVMARYRQLQHEFWSKQLQQAPEVLPKNQETLQQRVTELLQRRSGARLTLGDEQPSTGAEKADSKLLPGEPPVAMSGAGAPKAQQQQQPATSNGRPGTESGGKKSTCNDGKGNGVAVDVGTSGDGPDGEQEEQQQEHQQNPAGARKHQGQASSQKMQPVIAKFSTNETKLLKKQADRLQYEQRLPAYVSWMYLVRNELAVDKGQRMFYTDETGETVPASDDEDGNQKPWQSKDGLSHDYALMKMAEECHEDLASLYAALEAGLEERDENVTAEELANRVRQLKEADQPKVAPLDEDRRTAAFSSSLATFHQHFCRRCNIYNCRLHGGGHIQPVLQPAPLPPPPADAAPCSSSCWKAAADSAADVVGSGGGGGGTDDVDAGAGSAAGGHRAGSGAPVFDAYEEGLLQQGLKVFGRNPCSLALLLLDRSCQEVHQYLQLQVQQAAARQDNTAADSPAAAAAEAAAAARKRKKRGGGNIAIPARKHVMNKRWQAVGDEDWEPYTPCNCAGPCKKGSCSCINSANFCEKFCGCVGCEKRDCTFIGCTCTTRCRNDRCPCMAAGRECDPDLCKNCTSTAKGTAGPEERCGNMGMRLRQHARIHMGLSNVSGWGAFLGESARKGDFLGEYVGEMLSQAEADRRGKAYDRSNNSYLFGVNKLWVLDAKACGNKLRFANHRSNPNCQTRVLMVDGDHRVGIYAKEDIAAGEELFYNYRYDLDNAPDWAIRE